MKRSKLELRHSKQTDVMQVRVAFHNYMNAPNYWMFIDEICLWLSW